MCSVFLVAQLILWLTNFTVSGMRRYLIAEKSVAYSFPGLWFTPFIPHQGDAQIIGTKGQRCSFFDVANTTRQQYDSD